MRLFFHSLGVGYPVTGCYWLFSLVFTCFHSFSFVFGGVHSFSVVYKLFINCWSMVVNGCQWFSVLFLCTCFYDVDMINVSYENRVFIVWRSTHSHFFYFLSKNRHPSKSPDGDSGHPTFLPFMQSADCKRKGGCTGQPDAPNASATGITNGGIWIVSYSGSFRDSFAAVSKPIFASGPPN